MWQLDDQLRQDTIRPPRWEPYRSDTCDALVLAAGNVERLPDITMPSELEPTVAVFTARAPARRLGMTRSAQCPDYVGDGELVTISIGVVFLGGGHRPIRSGTVTAELPPRGPALARRY